jgi:nucleotide-binding universal stress UspA family protein
MAVYKTILLAYDGSESGQKALLESQEIGQWSHARMHLVAVMPLPTPSMPVEGWSYSAEADEAERQRYQSVLDSGVERLRNAGLEVQGELVTGSSIDQIVRVAKAIRSDLIVVGHKHLESWTERWWRGSVSKHLIEHAPCSVLVVITA